MTGTIIQKFGGSVLRDDAAVRRVALEVARAAEGGHAVVAVVSALASVTDRHLDRAKRFCAAADAPAIDLLLATGELESASLLALALLHLGRPAEALNPWQIGVRTDGAPGGARIVRINPLPLETRLGPGRVLVVPGFVGRSDDDRLTTLGRGGSDLTAVALAQALGAERCEFFKDVAGYFSADPALVPNARHQPEVTIEEALELSRAGCRFLQDRAIEWAGRSEARIRIRALEDARASSIVLKRAAPPQLVAITHMTAPEGGSGLVSLVGDRDAVTGRATREGSLDALATAGIPARVAWLTDHRLTIEVPLVALAVAHVILHDRFFAVATTAGREAC